MKIFLYVTLVAACSVCCIATSNFEEDLSSTCQEDDCPSYLDVAIDMITKAKCYIPPCNNYTKNKLRKAADCADLLEMGRNNSGVYEIWPMNRIMAGKSVKVSCDMDTDGGGWTVIQRRGDFNSSKDYFRQNWENYKKGFGNIEEDFWFGNDNIYALTTQKPYSVRFDLRDVKQEKRYAVYDKFWIDDEERTYTLHLSLYSGDAGDSMTYHNEQIFSTFDRDNKWNCAKNFKSGWWFKLCKEANLNGLYYKGNYTNKVPDGIAWKAWKHELESLEWTEIKIRPKHFRPAF